MAIERKKLDKIYLIVTLIIILAIIAGVVLFVVKPKNIDETNINLEDKTFIERKLKETEYNIFHIEIEYAAKGVSVSFYGYNTEYISITTGREKEIPYKNAIKSEIKKDVEKASKEEIEEAMNEYKKKAIEYLNYTNLELVSEFDRTIGGEEIDTSKSVYENIKDGKTVHYIVLFEERLNYEISFYVENDVLYGEISYYIPDPELPEDPNNEADNKVGVG